MTELTRQQIRQLARHSTKQHTLSPAAQARAVQSRKTVKNKNGKILEVPRVNPSSLSLFERELYGVL